MTIRHPAAVTGHDTGAALPAGKRPACGWPAMAMAPGRPLELRWNAPTRPGGQAWRLRIAVAVDDRQERIIQVKAAGSGRHLGRIDARFVFQLQPLELLLESGDATVAMEEGVRLEMTVRDGSPLWIVAPAQPAAGVPQFWSPHLVASPTVTPEHRRRAFMRWLCSLESIQTFGWRAQCVMDGLVELDQRVARLHLAQFHDPRGRLCYDDAHSDLQTESIPGLETTGMFAAIARLEPGHPMIDRVLEFWRVHMDDEGTVVDGIMTTAEGNYTVAYPMAVIARQRGDVELARAALRQLRIRRGRLRAGEDIYGRWHAGRKERSFGNWARAITWYALGLVRTLESLGSGQGADDLVEELGRVAAAVLRRQRPDGLWSNFADDPASAVDTSGSAGIAAAIAVGVRLGLLRDHMLDAAERAEAGLLDYLAPDGVLTGCAQDNRGGEALQRGDYRVIHPAGGGLMGQLVAALARPAARP